MGMELGVWDCTTFLFFVVELDGLVSFFNLTNYVTIVQSPFPPTAVIKEMSLQMTCCVKKGQTVLDVTIFHEYII